MQEHGLNWDESLWPIGHACVGMLGMGSISDMN